MNAKQILAALDKAGHDIDIILDSGEQALGSPEVVRLSSTSFAAVRRVRNNLATLYELLAGEREGT